MDLVTRACLLVSGWVCMDLVLVWRWDGGDYDMDGWMLLLLLGSFFIRV